MAAHARFVPAFLFLVFCSTAFSLDFPKIDDIVSSFYQTEVQVTDYYNEISVYATEYYDRIENRGALKMYFEGQHLSYYYDNSSLSKYDGTNCTVNDTILAMEDLLEFNQVFYGWLNIEPVIIGPSAALWHAEARRKDIIYEEMDSARAVMCHKFTLAVKNSQDNFTYEYYFAPSDWTTPYKYEKLLIPIRIRVIGESSRYTANDNIKLPIRFTYDFAYFKPSINDKSNLLPPVGVGCEGIEETDDFPDIPEAFQYSAEVVDLLAAQEDDMEIQYHTTSYNSSLKLARRDVYSRMKGFRSDLYDFNTGVFYSIRDNGSCSVSILRNTDFQKTDYGMTDKMKSAAEVLNLDGEFYEMGRRQMRGLDCDVFESVQTDKHFKGKRYSKLVVTAYFTDSDINVAINGKMETRIPIYYLINGYNEEGKNLLQMQYNVFAFNEVAGPEMYHDFRLDRCYTKPETKVYFILIFPVSMEIAEKMEKNDDIFISMLRSKIAENAKIPEMRIPYLKADYKPTGVFVTGIMLERPLAMLQFYYENSGSISIKDHYLKIVPKAENVEQCAYACVTGGKFLCKGFFLCNQACFLKSVDPFDVEDSPPENIGECKEYIRAEIDSSNFHQSYLIDALGYLEETVEAKNLSVKFPISDKDVVQVTVEDIIIGDGPYTGTDESDKSYEIGIELRKFNSEYESVRTMDYVGSLHDCYKRCKDAESQCSSFSFCPDSTNDNKECMISSELVIKGITKDTNLISDKNCNIYNVKFLDFFTPYPEKVSLLSGKKAYNNVETVESCAASCKLEKEFTCRGFEYCKSKKLCTMHEKHILELQPGDSGVSDGKVCTHYAARYITDYTDLGKTLIDDDGNVRQGTTLEECARMCSEDLTTDCKSFNYCPTNDEKGTDSSCAFSTKVLTSDGITTTEKTGCKHYEKRDSVHDWDNSKTKQVASGYTKKGFTGLVIGMIALGIIIGALGFIFYSYMRSRSSEDGMAVRFMKSES